MVKKFNLDETVGLLRDMALEWKGKPPSNGLTLLTKDAQQLFLETNCEVMNVIGGTVVNYEIKRKNLGAGVYRVWLEKIKK